MHECEPQILIMSACTALPCLVDEQLAGDARRPAVGVGLAVVALEARAGPGRDAAAQVEIETNF